MINDKYSMPTLLPSCLWLLICFVSFFLSLFFLAWIFNIYVFVATFSILLLRILMSIDSWILVLTPTYLTSIMHKLQWCATHFQLDILMLQFVKRRFNFCGIVPLHIFIIELLCFVLVVLFFSFFYYIYIYINTISYCDSSKGFLTSVPTIWSTVNLPWGQGNPCHRFQVT